MNDSTEAKRKMDVITLRSTMLEDIVFELRRRGIQIIQGRGLGLQGRVVFLPNPVEMYIHERPEVTAGDVTSGLSCMYISTRFGRNTTLPLRPRPRPCIIDRK